MSDTEPEDTFFGDISNADNPKNWRRYNLGLEGELAREIRTLKKQNSELWINARAMGWNIFSPDWQAVQKRVRRIPIRGLGELCALSVGLCPRFCHDLAWLVFEAKFHLNGEEPDLVFDSGLDDAHIGTYRAAQIDELVERMNEACGNLEPEGVLSIASGEANSQFTRVKATEFISWAQSEGWEMPTEFVKCFDSVCVTGTKKTDDKGFNRVADEYLFDLWCDCGRPEKPAKFKDWIKARKDHKDGSLIGRCYGAGTKGKDQWTFELKINGDIKPIPYGTLSNKIRDFKKRVNP